jgi:hypothetical protein
MGRANAGTNGICERDEKIPGSKHDRDRTYDPLIKSPLGLRELSLSLLSPHAWDELKSNGQTGEDLNKPAHPGKKC